MHSKIVVLERNLQQIHERNHLITGIRLCGSAAVMPNFTFQHSLEGLQAAIRSQEPFHFEALFGGCAAVDTSARPSAISFFLHVMSFVCFSRRRRFLLSPFRSSSRSLAQHFIVELVSLLMQSAHALVANFPLVLEAAQAAFMSWSFSPNV